MKRTGELLKKAREEKRLSLHEVALFLKINSRVLQAIEDGDQSQLPARTFLRGFIQSYAKFLKLDAQVILQVFAEETSPADVMTIEPDAAPAIEKPQSIEARKEAEAQAEVDSASLEKSILTQSQVAQDKLGFKTIAVSIVGLILVAILYFANSVVKKYQKEAQIDPVDSIAESVETDEPEELPAVETATPAVTTTPTENKPAVLPATTPATPAPNSVQPNSSSSNNSFISPFNLSSQKIDAKPKLPDNSETPPVEKPVAVKPEAPQVEGSTPSPKKPPEIPVAKPAAVAAAPVATPAVPVTAAAPTPEGKLVEVIVEANDAVEIEYSSSKTSPQKMFLKAEQIHIFKSRSGVRLKISNGGAVNIIMNGRDLGVPGATGQPVQVTY